MLELCDDGNKISGDGCSSTCQIEDGFKCRQSQQKKSVCSGECGNGRKFQAYGEQCDDGNNLNGDGCSSDCKIESDRFYCSFNQEGLQSACEPIGTYIPGQTTPSPSFCGNGYLEGGEECDDGFPRNGDGCSALCKIEAGWNCWNDRIKRGISYC